MLRAVPELWVLRHGETEWNAEGRLQGHLDSPLTEKGRTQARTQAAILASCLPKRVSVLSSPSPRALRTAELALEGTGREIATDARLMEIALGAWQGRTIEEIRLGLGDCWGDDPHMWKFGAPGGGETLEQMTGRITALLDELTGPAVLVTHGLTSRILRCLVLGLPPEALSSVPGGQGVVHHLKNGQATTLTG